jgi:Ca-activated chloride channel homolog
MISVDFARAEKGQAKAIDPTGGGIPQAAYNNGCTAFQAGDFETAARAFSVALGDGDAQLQERAAYNLANTLARRGAAQKERKDKITDWKNAMQHYDHALRLNANHADASHNRGLIEQAIAALEKEPPNQDKQEDKQEDKKDEEKKNDDKKDDKSQQDQKNGDEQKKDGEKQEQQQDDQKGDKKNEQEKSDGQKDEQAKKENGEQKPGDQGEPKDMKPQQGDQPKGEPKQGDIQPANPGQPGDEKDEQAAEAAEAAAAALEGRMTEKDAKQLLDSLRRYDVRGRLQDPKDVRRSLPRQFKNW